MTHCKLNCDMNGPEWAFRKMSRMHHIAHKAIFDSLGLKVGQPVMLFVLSDMRKNGESCTQVELCKLLDLSPSTITISIKSLEKSGYIKRHVDELDKRRNYVEITDAGESAAEKCRTAFDSVDRAMYEGFSQEEKAMATAIFNRIAANLSSVTEKYKGGM